MNSYMKYCMHCIAFIDDEKLTSPMQLCLMHPFGSSTSDCALFTCALIVSISKIHVWINIWMHIWNTFRLGQERESNLLCTCHHSDSYTLWKQNADIRPIVHQTTILAKPVRPLCRITWHLGGRHLVAKSLWCQCHLYQSLAEALHAYCGLLCQCWTRGFSKPQVVFALFSGNPAKVVHSW